MSDNGFIQITHDLLRCDEYLSAPADQRCVLITILDRACFSPCTQNDHGVKIHLLPGQLMTTLRDLAKLSGTNKKVVERTIARFSKCQILGLEVRHIKTVITILWGIKYETCGTENGTRKGQERDLKEEDKKTRPVSSTIYKSLEDIDEKLVNRKEKTRICNRYEETEVNRGVEYVLSLGDEIPETFLKSLNTALKYGWEPVNKKEDDFEINKKFAEAFQKPKGNNYTFEAGRESMEIGKGMAGMVYVPYKLSKKKFLEKLKQEGKL